MLASAANFKCFDFSNHVSHYKFEIERYLTLVDILRYLSESKGFLLGVPLSERYLVMYFLTQRMLYSARRLEYILRKKMNEFKLDNFEKFSSSKTYNEMLGKVQTDCKEYEALMVKYYNTIKEEKADEKLPENISSSITEYIFIDFEKESY